MYISLIHANHEISKVEYTSAKPVWAADKQRIANHIMKQLNARGIANKIVKAIPH